MILVAEDDLDDQYLLQLAFSEAGMADELVFVTNGIELIKYLESSATLPELIFLDLNMPLKGGKETLRELKAHPIFKPIPTLVYTTTRSEIDIRDCYELGANTYIVKPASFERLREVVKNVTQYWLVTASIVASQA